MFGPFKPAPHIAELPAEKIDSTYKRLRWQVFAGIFFGYAAGVGKTYAMLQAAHQAKANGTEVVAGYIEPHSRPQTSALLDGLEQLPVKQVLYGEMILREFDIDSALKRKPQLILVDELAQRVGKPSCQALSGRAGTFKCRDRCLHHCQCSAY